MKKSVLAVAIAAAAFAASAASAAQVYDKDGTTLAVGGQIEFMAGNAGNTYFGDKTNQIGKSADATTRDRARLTMAGRTQLTSNIAAYAYNEWQAQHSATSDEATSISARQQFLGVDFGTFGKVQMGRYKDPFVFASSTVDVLDEVGVYGCNDERNSGHLSYMWKGFGFDAGVSYQFAEDKYKTDTEGSFNVDSGFSIYAGYTSPAVVFGPISVRAAYLYLNGQDEDDIAATSSSHGYSYLVDDLKTVDGSISWGTNGKGLYIATNYAYSKATAQDVDGGEHKVKAWESVVTYGFDSGIRIGASYHYINDKIQADRLGSDEFDQKFFQLIADYNVTPNFKIWAETCIDAGSDDYHSKITNFALTDDKDSHNSVMFGARYVF